MLTIFHIFIFSFCIILYFHILKHIDYIHIKEHGGNSFLIEYQNNKELQKLCDKDKILIFDSPCHIDYNGIIQLSNTTDDETIEVPFNAFIKLLYCKTSQCYFSHTTPIFTEHVVLSNLIHNPLSLDKECSLLGGPCGYKTPHYFHNFHRKFLYVAQGSIRLYLQPLEQQHNINKDIKTLEYFIDNVDISNYETIELKSGQIVFIPHNYIYMIEYREPVNIVYDLTSHSISSLCVNLKDIILHKIQTRNVFVKDVDVNIDEMLQPESEKETESEIIITQESDNDECVNNSISID